MSKTFFLFIFISLNVIHVCCFAQPKLSYEFEIGVNSSSVPHIEKFDGGKEIDRPLFSPRAGLSITRTYRKHFSYTLGLQFYKSGRVSTYKRETYDPIANSNYTVETFAKVALTQFAIPLHVKYNFRAFSQNLYVLAGYSFSNFFSGKHHYRSTVIYSPDVNRDAYSERSFNPFSNEMKTQARKTSSLLVLGVGTHVTERISVQLTFATSLKLVQYAEQKPPYVTWDDPSYTHSLKRNDFAATVKYIFKKIR